MVQIKRENRRKVYEYLLNEGVIVVKKVPHFLHSIGLQFASSWGYRCPKP
jgi:hypothetical protein